MKKKIFNDATHVFKKLANDEDNVEEKNKINELLQILCNEYASHWLVDIINMPNQPTQANQPLIAFVKWTILIDHILIQK